MLTSMLIALDLSPIAQPAISLLGLALTALCGIAAHALLSHVKNAKALAILSRAYDFMAVEVKALAQTEVPTLTRVVSTGKLTSSDAQALRDKAIGFVKLNLGPDGLKALGAATGDRSVDDFLASLLESHVGELSGPIAHELGEIATAVAGEGHAAPDATKPVLMTRSDAAVAPAIATPETAEAPKGAAGFAAMPALIGAVILAVSLAVVGALSGCAGTTTSIGLTGGGSGTSWTAGVTIGITVAQAALPVVQTQLDSATAIPAATRAAINTAFRTAGDALGIASTALQEYTAAQSVTSQCRVHGAVEDAITAILQGIHLAKDAGLVVDPTITAAVGALGTIADELFPGCASSGSPATTQRISAASRIRASLSGR